MALELNSAKEHYKVSKENEEPRKTRSAPFFSISFFKISITTVQLARCSTVPWAYSQAELFGTGCVGCVITANVIIEQGIYNVTLFTCL